MLFQYIKENFGHNLGEVFYASLDNLFLPQQP
ncbi:MAG: hypothetical protein WCG61_03765 [Chlorobium sp.]